MLKLCGADINEEDNISVLENTIKFKDQVVTRYLADRFADKRPRQPDDFKAGQRKLPLL